MLNKKFFLPTTKDEIDKLGWDQPDIIIFSGDAYIDHPSFGAAVIGRVLQKEGYKVAIVPQPNWRDDLRDFRKLGKPKLFFGVSAGAMDSMVNHYTANKRLRHSDAYTPGDKHGMRPDYPTIVYSKILKELYPDVPVVAGGIEASMRRLSHYDYWQDKLLPSILIESKADMLCYGMGERTMKQIANRLRSGEKISDIKDLHQTVFISEDHPGDKDVVLHSFEDCLQNKHFQSENFKEIETQSNKFNGDIIWQYTHGKWIKVNPMFPPMTESELDEIYALPFTRVPHPRYSGKIIPAYEMIRHSITLHRGCFGGCAFCTISAHQGKFISSRSKDSIIQEVVKVTEMDDFKGFISDLGGPSANMYSLSGKKIEICKKCIKPSCLYPSVCNNLNTDHSRLLELYKEVDKNTKIKKSFVSSGVRYDLSMAATGISKTDESNKNYLKELICNHVSGRLKVAPEHTQDNVLKIMRKPSFSLFRKFKSLFDDINRKYNLRQQLIPYFISSHPACRLNDMAELASETKDLNYHLEQVQDFTPTPMTLASEIFYSGYNPYTGEKIYTATSEKEKQAQRRMFFWYKSEDKALIVKDLKRIKRFDIINKLFGYIPKNKKK